MIQASKITVTASPTLIFTAGEHVADLTIHDPAVAVDVHIGGTSTLSTANGFLMEGGDVIPIRNIFPGEQVWGTVASGTEVVYYIANHQ